MKGSEKVESSAVPTMRDLMPAGFLPALCKATGAANLSNMSQVVSLENGNSRYWPAVLDMAERNDPAGFARWAAAHPEKLPAKAAA